LWRLSRDWQDLSHWPSPFSRHHGGLPLRSLARHHMRLPALVVLLIAVLVGCSSQPRTVAAGSGLHVRGNHLVDASDRVVRLLGVDRSGTEYACIQGWGIFDGPSDAKSVQAMVRWHINAVRVPLNEDCWLGINGVAAQYSGAAYRRAITRYVSILNQQHLTVILDLHWSAPGTSRATEQLPMPDRDHAPTFWRQVASTFKGHGSVVFDLYNEPYPDSNQDTAAAWQCWIAGGTCPGVSFQAAGMQELVNAVRSTGANNLIMLGGVEYAGSLSQWLSHEPIDPKHNLAASWHSYNFSACHVRSCWDATVAPVTRRVPVIAGEIGENACKHAYIDRLMPWLDRHDVSYLGWTWDTWNCSSGPALIRDYDGAPTGYGAGLKKHLASLAPPRQP
jgi:endoglucanase